jgi:hypothetical protein
MKMAPRAATEVLLGLPPLHLNIEVEAQAGVYICRFFTNNLYYTH